MRIAVFSDVHGNLLALDAVLTDVSNRSVDLAVNLGDLLSGGLQPRETADRLMAVDLPTVRGNHERQLLTTPPERLSRSDRLAHDTITDRHREWLAGLPATLQPADGVLAFHGSPTDDLTYLLETVEETGARQATDAEVLERPHPPPARPPAQRRHPGGEPRQRRLAGLLRRPAAPARHGGRDPARPVRRRRRRERAMDGRPARRRLRLDGRGSDRRAQRPAGRRPRTAHGARLTAG
jgi:hypothetical protein